MSPQILLENTVAASNTTQPSHKTGRVGIGLPVYNGERYVEAAIRSIVEQSFEDFQLIIGDNASTDGTEEICRSFASDPRVHYVRRERNVGATPNYNDLMDRLDSPLVRWQACDDVLAETYLERCVELLDEHPDAPMAHTEATIIDEHGDVQRDWDLEHPLASEDPTERWTAMAKAWDWHSIFGLVRREVVDRVGVFPIYPGSDRWVLAGWLLQGRPRYCSEHLFLWRDHPETFRRSANSNQKSAEEWWSSDLRSWPMRTTVLGYRHGLGVIKASGLDAGTRQACRRILRRQIGGPVLRRIRSLLPGQ